VRVGETDHVLKNIERRTDIWWLIVYEEGDGLKYTYVQSSARSNLPLLLDTLKRIQDKKHLLFAVRRGWYHTDIFLMETPKVIRYLEEHRKGSG